jgi:hypothetical protein
VSRESPLLAHLRHRSGVTSMSAYGPFSDVSIWPAYVALVRSCRHGPRRLKTPIGNKGGWSTLTNWLGRHADAVGRRLYRAETTQLFRSSSSGEQISGKKSALARSPAIALGPQGGEELGEASEPPLNQLTDEYRPSMLGSRPETRRQSPADHASRAISAPGRACRREPTFE